jgi:glycosyltransferase involved in cell wall biosynthesis
VIPCFQAERWLAGAIESALGQSWRHVDVIVVDDGSTDRSVDIARSYGSRVQTLTGPNQGPSAARNRGIAASQGAWVQFLDADDVLLPYKVEACLVAASSRDGIPFGAATTVGARPASSWTGRLRHHPSFQPDDPLTTALTFEVQTSQPLYPTRWLRAVGGFREAMRWLEDIDLNVRLVLAGARFVPVSEVLVLLRDHPGRLRLHPDAARGRLHGEALIRAAVQAAGPPSTSVRQALADRLAYAARQAWVAGAVEEAERAFADAKTLAPSPRPTGVPLYNAAVALLGLDRAERWRRALG